MSTATMEYEAFVKEKANFDQSYGFDIDQDEINELLKPHQRDIVQWAVLGGCRAIFAKFGLGKSMMQLETLRITIALAGGSALIICPLGVRTEFAKDAAKLGIETKFIRSAGEIVGDGIYITNYETVRDGKLDPNLFTAVSLDEAGVLRSYGSKTYQTFLTLFEDVAYRFVATATPSPNKYKELIHYAGFLGIMDTGQALTRFFQRDSTQANNLQLYPHKEKEFWLWLNSWAIFLQRPSDLGYSDEGYDLPPLDLQWHEVAVDHSKNVTIDRDGQAHLFRGAALDLQGSAKEKRLTLRARVDWLMGIVTEHGGDESDQIILWCDLNDEQSAIEAELKAAGLSYSSIHGSLSIEEAERRLEAWRNRETYALIGKPVMLGQGMNLQQSNTAVFVGITHKFNQIIQAIHRTQRFGQTRKCFVHLIHAESEQPIVQDLKVKFAKDKELKATMSKIIAEHGLNRTDINDVLTRSMGVDRIEAAGEGWLVANNDCVKETKLMDENSVDLIVTSIPFSNHYEYTPSYNDFGHTDNNDHFWAQMDFLTPELYRVLAPGRIYACHVKDRINFASVTGAGVPTVSPFHMEAGFHGIKHGFDYLGMITVVTDVVRENNQTYRLGYSEMCKDGTKMGVGSPEYILIFHKPQTDRSKGYADAPVTKSKENHYCQLHGYLAPNGWPHDDDDGPCDPADPCAEGYSLARWQVDAHAYWRTNGNRPLTPEELSELPPEQLSRTFTEQTLREVYDYESHIKVGEYLQGKGALPSTFMALAPGSWNTEVWHDVNRMLTLNGEQKRRNVQGHICPLQFDIVDRIIERYSNKGDLVYDPFNGLGTVPLRALRAGRRGRGAELNTGYFLDSVKYLQAEERKRDMPSLFDLEGDAA